jgi:hypothetical protein
MPAQAKIWSHSQAAQDGVRGVGRPKAITEKDVRKLTDLFKVGHSVAMACAISGVPRSTYYDEITRNEEFSDRMQAAQEVLTYRATQNVYRRRQPKNSQMVAGSSRPS